MLMFGHGHRLSVLECHTCRNFLEGGRVSSHPRLVCAECAVLSEHLLQSGCSFGGFTRVLEMRTRLFVS